MASLPSLLDLPHVLTHSGRSAILLALHALKVRPGDRVLVPTYHCPTMIAPVERIGAIPVFYPINDSGEPALDWLDNLKWHGIKAVLAAHFFGRLIDLAPLARLCERHGARLIEDCAHAFYGSTAHGAVGATGEFAIGSLPKFFPVAEGGVLASRKRISSVAGLLGRGLTDEMRAAWRVLDLAATAGRLGVTGALIRSASRLRRGTVPQSDELGAVLQPMGDEIRARGLDDRLLAPVRLTQLETLIIGRKKAAAAIDARRRNFDTIANGLADLAGVRPLIGSCSPGMAPYVLPLLVKDPDPAYLRMRAAGLPVFRWDQRWPGTPALPDDAGEVWARGVIQVACHQSIEPRDLDCLVRSISACVNQGT